MPMNAFHLAFQEQSNLVFVFNIMLEWLARVLPNIVGVSQVGCGTLRKSQAWHLANCRWLCIVAESLQAFAILGQGGFLLHGQWMVYYGTAYSISLWFWVVMSSKRDKSWDFLQKGLEAGWQCRILSAAKNAFVSMSLKISQWQKFMESSGSKRNLGLAFDQCRPLQSSGCQREVKQLRLWLASFGQRTQAHLYEDLFRKGSSAWEQLMDMADTEAWIKAQALLAGKSEWVRRIF